MSNFTNQVGGVQISTPSIQQPVVNNFAGNLLGAVGSGLDLWQSLQPKPTQLSQSEIDDNLKMEGSRVAYSLLEGFNSVKQTQGEQEARKWLDTAQRKAAAGISSFKGQEAFLGVIKTQFGSPIEAERETQRRAREAEQDKYIQDTARAGMEMFLAQGLDPSTVPEEQLLAAGMQYNGQAALMQQRQAQLSIKTSEMNIQDRERTVVSNLVFDGFLSQETNFMNNLITSNRAALADPSTATQTRAALVTQLERMSADMEIQASDLLKANGGSLQDVDTRRLSAHRAMIDFQIKALRGDYGVTVMEQALTAQGLSTLTEASAAAPEGQFARMATLTFATGNRLGTGDVLRAATGRTPYKFFDTATVQELGQRLSTGTPPTSQADTPVYWSALGAGIKEALQSNDGQVVQEAGRVLVNSLFNGLFGLRSQVQASNSSQGLPKLYSDVAKMDGPQLAALQASVTEALESEGLSPVDVVAKQAQITYMDKILPALRTWDYAQAIDRTVIEATGSGIKVTFNAPIASDNPAIRSIAKSPSLGSNPRDQDILRGLREAERRLNEMVISYSKLTGMSKQEVAEVLASQYNLAKELGR